MGIFRQFPYTNFHEMNLDEIIKIMREMQDEWNTTKQEWATYKDFIDNYFTNLDVSEEVLEALRTLASTGELNTIIDPTIATATAEWLAEHITPTTPAIDSSLTISGAGADAKVTGDNLKKAFSDMFYSRNIKYIPTANPKWSINGNTLTIIFETETRYLNNGVSLTIPPGTYNIDISGTHMLGVFWNGTTFVTQFYENLVPNDWYLFLITYNQKIVYNSLYTTIKDHIARISIGLVFMYVSQSTLHFYVPTLDVRCVCQNLSFVLPRGDMTFECPNVRVPYYMVINSTTDISLKYYTQLNSADNILAYVIGQEVFPLSDNIMANKMPLPTELHSRNDVAFFINRERLGYDILAGNIIKNDNTMKNYGSTIRLYNYRPTTYRLADRLNDNPFTIAFSANTTSIANKKILMVGDSITNRGWIQRRLLEYVPSLTFLGTKQTGSGQGVTDYMCEATPGATAKQMIGEGSTINMNFTNYVNNELGGVVPDYVTIEFGLNETNSEDYITYIQALINSIKAYNANIKIYVLMPFERCLTQNMGTGYNFTYAQYSTNKRIILDSASFSDCVLIPTYFIFDDRYDYTHITQTGYGYGVEIDMVPDFVHPSETVGFLKLADMIYHYLGV